MQTDQANRSSVTETSIYIPPVARSSPEGCLANCAEGCMIFGSWVPVVLFFPFSIFACISLVKEYERAVIFRLGHLRSGVPRGPGIFFLLPCIDEMKIVDIRTVTCIVDPQELLTKDSVTVKVDAVVYHRVFEPMSAVTKVYNYGHSTRLLASSTLRNVLGTKDLRELLADRESIAKIMQNTLDKITTAWGVKVERVEIKDVRLPPQMQRAMATEAEAAREAQAKVISAEGEKRSAQALKEAADIISKSPSALQLRYLQTLHDITNEHSSTVVFPIPGEMMRGVFGEARK